MFYDKRKPMRGQLKPLSQNPKEFKRFVDDYIQATIHRHSQRDILLLQKIKQRTDEAFAVQLKKEQEQRSSKIVKKVIEEMGE